MNLGQITRQKGEILYDYISHQWVLYNLIILTNHKHQFNLP